VLILIQRHLLRRTFSFRVFSYDAHFRSEHSENTLVKLVKKVKLFSAFSCYAYFHSAPSPRTHIFIPRLLLRRTFSFRAFSYGLHFHSALSPYTLIFYNLNKEISFHLYAFPAILWGRCVWMQEGVGWSDVVSDRK
jgi:hypothetical protein